MHPNEAEVRTLTDGEGETTGIMVQFPDEAVTYDTPDEAREFCDRTEQALRDEGIEDPEAVAFLEDIRERAHEWEGDE